MVRRAFVRVGDGEIHYAEEGAGPAVLLLHQTPRSWAEYRDVLPVVDGADTVEDGSHLVALWQGRAGFYPQGRPDLLERFVRDALKAGLPATHEGHRAVAEYAMEDKLGAIRVPVLLIGATADPFA